VVPLIATLAGHAPGASLVAVVQGDDPSPGHDPCHKPITSAGRKSPPACTITSSSRQHISPDTKLPVTSSGPTSATSRLGQAGRDLPGLVLKRCLPGQEIIVGHR